MGARAAGTARIRRPGGSVSASRFLSKSRYIARQENVGDALDGRRALAAVVRMPLASFWKGKRVFLTGHTGFKGSWLALRLVDLGASITGFALAPEGTPNTYDLLKIDEH